MVGSGLAAASLLFFFGFSPAPTVTKIQLPALALSQSTSDTKATPAQSQSGRDKSSAATPASGEAQASPAVQKEDPLKRPLAEKKKKAARLAKEGSAYDKWLNEEVPWIITDEERAAFKLLSNDEEREKFIEHVWDVRDPTPGTVENEFRDEYYRRVMYANERFSAGVPGWKTDRGRIYIVYGPPDEIESHPSGGTYDYPQSQGGGSSPTFPFELWRYRYIADIGSDITIEFVDPCMCGDFHMTMDPNEKDALAHLPSGQQRLQNAQKDNSREFEDLDRYAKLNRQPKFKDLKAIVTTRIDYHTMPFEVLTNYVKATSNITLVPLTLQIKNEDMTYKSENGVSRGAVNIYGQVTTIGGKIATTFEDTVQLDVPQSVLPNMLGKSSVYGNSLPLAPGRYLLEIVVKDINSDHIGTLRQRLEVPDYDDELSASSIILADKMERVSPRDIGHGPFVIGDMFVRPRVPGATSTPAVFKRGERVNVWMQIYNLAVDEKDGTSDADVEFDVVQEGTKKVVLHGTQPSEMMRRAVHQITLEKTFSSNVLEPGLYRLKVHVRDQIAKQGVEPEAIFAIE
jgi:GWxTD domain-containing protein